MVPCVTSVHRSLYLSGLAQPMTVELLGEGIFKVDRFLKYWVLRPDSSHTYSRFFPRSQSTSAHHGVSEVVVLHLSE